MVRYSVFISTVKTARFVCGSMSRIVLRGHFNDTVVLGVHLQTEDRCDDSKVHFCVELEEVFYHFHQYPMKILLDF
jgi:hypothetical protein